MVVNNPVGNFSLMIADYTKVYEAAAPVGWTDLDLSAVVGARQALVILHAKNNSSGVDIVFWLRRNGDTNEYYGTSNSGINRITVSNNLHAYAACLTDVSGIVEWRCTGAHAVILYMEAYVINP